MSEEFKDEFLLDDPEGDGTDMPETEDEDMDDEGDAEAPSDEE